jgi:hypothetical protein
MPVRAAIVAIAAMIGTIGQTGRIEVESIQVFKYYSKPSSSSCPNCGQSYEWGAEDMIPGFHFNAGHIVWQDW